MKEFLEKFEAIENGEPLTESSAQDMSSMKDILSNMDKVMLTEQGTKPVPVMKQGTTDQAGTAMIDVTDTGTGGEAIEKAIDDLAAQGKINIIQQGQPVQEEEELDEKLETERIKHPVGKRPPGIGWTLKQAGEQTGKDHSVWERKFKRVKPTNEETELDEKWAGDVKVDSTGEHAGKTIAELKKELTSVKNRMAKYKKEGKKVPHDLRSEFSQLTFAIRAKKDWKGGVSEEVELDEKWAGNVKVNSTGEHAGKTIDELKKELTSVKNRMAKYKKEGKKVPHDLRSEFSQLTFAIRAKKDWKGGVSEDQVDEVAPLVGIAARAAGAAAGNAIADKVMGEGQVDEISDKAKTHYKKAATKDRDKAIDDFAKFGSKSDRDRAEKRNKGLSKVKESFADYVAEAEHKMNEKITKKTSIGDTIKDFYKSDAPQFKGKSKDKRREMAVAAYLEKHDGKKESVHEADRPYDGPDFGAGLGSGRSEKHLEEGMNTKLMAARHEGKSHGLQSHKHCGKSYEDIEERKAYHEGYKEGLDECYGLGVYEDMHEMDEMRSTVRGMADEEMEEGNEFTGALAKAKASGAKEFEVDGKTYDVKEDEMFESWDNELLSLLSEGSDNTKVALTEGLNVNVSRGNEGEPDSVSVSASGPGADELLDVVKKAGLGMFDGHGEEGHDDHEGHEELDAPSHELELDGTDMLGLMNKMATIDNPDYADEGGCDESMEEEMHEDLDANQKRVGQLGPYEKVGPQGAVGKLVGEMEEDMMEVETDDQREFQVAEKEEFKHPRKRHHAESQHESMEEEMHESDCDESMEEEMHESDCDESMEEMKRIHELAGMKEETDSEADEDAEAEEDMAIAISDLKEKMESIHEDDDEEEEDHDGIVDLGDDDFGDDDDHDYSKDMGDESHRDAGKDITDMITDILDCSEKYDIEKLIELPDDSIMRIHAKVCDHMNESDCDESEKLEEWANDACRDGTDQAFQQDIDFMTKVIAGGLNKEKTTGQSTVPVIADQDNRQGISESVDLARLAGIKNKD